VEAAAAPAIAIVMTTGANLGRPRATATMMTYGRWDAVPETKGKGRTGMGATAITTHGGAIAIGTVENAIARFSEQLEREWREMNKWYDQQKSLRVTP